MKASDFSLPDQNGKVHRLSNYKGQMIVLYFYPKDDTPGCTKEACGFRDNQKLFKQKNIVIFGVSKDSVESHTKFAKKYDLNFPILSDIDKKVLNLYKAWGEKKFMGKTYMGTLRKTYLIDKTGSIVKVYDNVDPLVHAEEILKDSEKL
jgi:peroxiredoxin Q/BCP